MCSLLETYSVVQTHQTGSYPDVHIDNNETGDYWRQETAERLFCTCLDSLVTEKGQVIRVQTGPHCIQFGYFCAQIGEGIVCCPMCSYASLVYDTDQESNRVATNCLCLPCSGPCVTRSEESVEWRM